MKFLRHLAAVVLVVAVIVALGMLWAHASGSGAGFGPGSAPANGTLRLEQIKAGVAGPADSGFDLADSSNLIRTCVIEAGLAAVVITVSAMRRRQRRARRAAGAGKAA